MTRALIAPALALALLCAAVAHADVYGGGSLARGSTGASAIDATVTNNSSAGEVFEAVQIQLPSGTTATAVTAKSSGAPANCVPGDGAVVQCQFAAPFMLPGDSVTVSFNADPRLSDGAGAGLSVCASPCTGTYSGPFLMLGPTEAIDAVATVRRWRAGRARAGDACTKPRKLFAVAAVSLCSARGGRVLRGIVVNSGEFGLPLTITAPAYTKRVRVPGAGAAGFERRGRLRRGMRFTFVNGESGAKTSLPIRPPPKAKRG